MGSKNYKVIKLKKLSEYEKGYIEASIDTDGWISLLRQKNGARINIGFANNSIEYLNKIQRILETNYKLKKKGDTKNYTFQCGLKVAKWLLPQIELVIKDDRRKLILKYMSLKKPKNQFDVISEEYKNLINSL